MHRSRAYLLSALIAVFLLSSVSIAPGATRSEVDASLKRAAQAREAAKKAETQAAQLRDEAEALDSTIREINDQVRGLDSQVTEATARTQRLLADVRDLEAKVAGKEAEIAETQAEYDFQQTLLNERMTASYKQGKLFYLDLLFDSKTINDLIARTSLVQRVIAADNDVAAQLIDTGKRLQTAHAELERTLATAAAKRAEAAAVEKNLRSARSQRQSALNNQKAAQAQKTALMQESEADAKRWKEQAAEEEAAARKLEAELRAVASAGSGQYHGGVMAWPVPGGSITSGYGYRTHPVFKQKKFHHGIDISRGGGTILAAGDGKVVGASYGWNSGYGNKIMIDHGDGLTTVYAHILAGGIKISTGQTVTKGQPIALVGSTGYSTGPHLHFEVRVNGASTNPVPYVR
ncbi:MAG: peptidoglycan DD-metalloendopeptidase family protein [Coriobacteriia bacterium]|jgi:murein DD-endopeptidase MepM/ murein hydrolase activator NlpD|nr:peptidoglycan DD-metalloendopeptidase family protein [Coriobacteriia bacterium]